MTNAIQKKMYAGGKPLLLFILLLLIQTISHSQTPGASDSVLISKYKAESVKAQLRADTLNAKVDSLKKIVTDKNAASNKTVFIGSSIATCVICILIGVFIFYVVRKSPSDKQFALGLPDGSVRAIIAILAIVFYILASVTLSLITIDSTIPSDVTKTLGNLVVAISAFYFGSKTAEQSSRTTTDNISKVLKKNE